MPATLLMPGAGHLFLGYTKRAVVWFLAALLLLPAALLLTETSPSAFWVGLILAIALPMALVIAIASVVDFLRTPVRPAGLPSYWQVAIALAAFIVVNQAWGMLLEPTTAIKARYVEAFRISSGGLIPTLLVGDHILVDKFIYRFRDPARGDVVVFAYPLDEDRDFVKRVIGLPGETVYIEGRQIFINCRPPDPSCQPIKDPWGYFEDRPGIGGEAFGPVQVPPRSYFVMGDNRNNSQDSRYWGFVKGEKIKGQVSIIYWSWDSEQGRVRWSRLARVVH